MPTVHIVTDSCAHFVDADIAKQPALTVLPVQFEIGAARYHDGADFSNEEGLRLIDANPAMPRIIAPTVAEYTEVYVRLLADYDHVLSIHASSALFDCFKNARRAAQQVGQQSITVIDSQTLCTAQGMLVKVALEAVGQPQTEHDKPLPDEKTRSIDDLVRMVRGAVDRIYAVYYVEKLDYLLHNQIMTSSHAMLGTLLGIKPFLSMEEGRLTIIEKVQTPLQAVERLVEFVVEFTHIEQAAIVQHQAQPTEQTRLLQERLTEHFTTPAFPHTVYSPALATLIGPDATGVVILEEEMDLLR